MANKYNSIIEGLQKTEISKINNKNANFKAWVGMYFFVCALACVCEKDR